MNEHKRCEEETIKISISKIIHVYARWMKGDGEILLFSTYASHTKKKYKDEDELTDLYLKFDQISSNAFISFNHVHMYSI
jgi:hypothetical protein